MLKTHKIMQEYKKIAQDLGSIVLDIIESEEGNYKAFISALDNANLPTSAIKKLLEKPQQIARTSTGKRRGRPPREAKEGSADSY